MDSSRHVTLPLGALVHVHMTDDGPAEDVYGAYGVVCGTGVYSGCLDEHDHNGDRVFGAFQFEKPGYKLLVMGCTDTNHIFSLGTIVNVAQTYVRLVKPGDFIKALERWSKDRDAKNPEYAAVGHSLRMLVAREEYAMRDKWGGGYKTRWSNMYPGAEYPLADERPDKKRKLK